MTRIHVLQIASSPSLFGIDVGEVFMKCGGQEDAAAADSPPRCASYVRILPFETGLFDMVFVNSRPMMFEGQKPTNGRRSIRLRVS